MTLLLAADETTRAYAAAKVRDMIERLGEQGQRNLDAILAALGDARARLVALAATGTDFDQSRARVLIDAINSEVARLRGSLPPIVQQGFRGALDRGHADVNEQARAVLPDDAFRAGAGISVSLVQVANERAIDLVGQIGDTARATLVSLMRRSAAGSSKPADVARAIGAVLSEAGRPEGVFGNLATQVERVHRTETAMLYQVSGQVRTAEIARESPFVLSRRWITLLDGRERASHREMNGVTVPVGEKFIVNGVPCDGPVDSVLPAEDAVNCRCSVALVRGPRKDAA